MDLTRIRAILLDMDGTIVDSDAAVERAWTTWSGEYGADLATVLQVAHGAPAESTVRHAFPGLAEAGRWHCTHRARDGRPDQRGQAGP